MPTIIPKPQYVVTLEGEQFGVVFDTNINETKRGIKMRFVPQNQNIDIRQLSEIANKIAVILQKKFADYGIQIDRDTQVRNPMIIGFIIPLVSISDFIMKKVIQGA
jgi:sporulation protein YlmC with PRC-barrel domain